jgi:hypothetical protein
MESHDTNSCPVVPSDMSTLKLVGIGKTDTAVEPLMGPMLAVITLCPAAWPLANPAEVIVSTVGEEEFQSTLLVTSPINPLA